MLKMLIVEDERWEREGLIDFLDWKSLGIELAGLACDGIEGIEQANRIRPDIIITDIKMPGMDGLKMSGKIREFLPEVKIILLTGYDDFKLAQEAIKINANAYVLKPVEEEELLGIISKVVNECTENRMKQEENTRIRELMEKSTIVAINTLMLDLLRGKKKVDSIRLQPFMGPLPGEGFQKVIALKAFEDREDGIGDPIPLKAANMDVFIPELKKADGTSIYHVYDEVDDTVYIWFADTGSNESINCAEKAFLKAIGEQQGIKTLMGIGNIVKCLDDLPTSCSQAEEALNYVVFRGDVTRVNYMELAEKQRNYSRNIGEFMTTGSFYNKQLLHSLRAADEERTYTLLDDMFMMIDANTLLGRDTIGNYLYGVVNEISLLLYNINHDINMDSITEKPAGSKLLSLSRLTSMKEYVYDYIDKVLELIRDKKNNKDENLVKKVEELIHARYSSDISLKTIASEVYLSPNYLGSIFKRSTGKSFNDYLCQLRMEKAKELLQSPKNKVSWVAQEVGILNTSYFCMLFRNEYGIAPGEYQESVIRNF